MYIESWRKITLLPKKLDKILSREINPYDVVNEILEKTFK